MRIWRDRMHEHSIMMGIVQAALKAVEGYEVENVECMYLEVGELTFLNPEQLKFSFKVLTEENVLSGAELKITEQKAEILCQSCGYRGGLPDDVEELHFRMPRIYCPKCKGKVELLKGRECVLKNIEVNVRNEGAGAT